MKNIITPIFYLLIVTKTYSQQTKTICVVESYYEITKEKWSKKHLKKAIVFIF